MAIMITSHIPSNFYYSEVKIQEVKSIAGVGGFYASARAHGGKSCQIYWRVVGENKNLDWHKKSYKDREKKNGLCI